jgi:hypothetical protein
MTQRACVTCGQLITVTTRNPNRRFCSPRCRVADWHARHDRPPRTSNPVPCDVPNTSNAVTNPVPPDPQLANGVAAANGAQRCRTATRTRRHRRDRPSHRSPCPRTGGDSHKPNLIAIVAMRLGRRSSSSGEFQRAASLVRVAFVVACWAGWCSPRRGIKPPRKVWSGASAARCPQYSQSYLSC